MAIKLTKEELLNQALTIIKGDRNLRYGDPKINYKRIIEGWQLILGTEITEGQYGMMMIWMKIARLMEDETHMDSWIDIAGYAACTGEVIDDK
tara:strand:- start:168 stop:446 length:279 start_codon:yes stop_codon:yes gene_type:complete